MKEMLNIINEEDEVIGQASRKEIHRLGLLHREVHVYFITPDKRFVFQHRAKDKDTYPDLLDAAVGGHVEQTDTYLEAAIRETEEETGLLIKPEELISLGKNKRSSKDARTGKINNVIGESYIFIFKGKDGDLKPEEGKSLGFEFWPLEKFKNISEREAERFIPYILEYVDTEVIKFIQTI